MGGTTLSSLSCDPRPRVAAHCPPADRGVATESGSCPTTCHFLSPPAPSVSSSNTARFQRAVPTPPDSTRPVEQMSSLCSGTTWAGQARCLHWNCGLQARGGKRAQSGSKTLDFQAAKGVCLSAVGGEAGRQGAWMRNSRCLRAICASGWPFLFAWAAGKNNKLRRAKP